MYPNNADLFALDANGNPIPNVPHFDLTSPTANQIRNLSNYIYSTNNYAPTKLNSHGLYLQDQITYKKWQVLLSLRREYYNDLLNFGTESEEEVTQSVWLPRAGLVYSLNNNVNLYGTYVAGYQPQSASAINDPLAGGPFDPLESNMIEFGAKTDWIEGRLGVSVAVYDLTQTGTLFPANDVNNPELLRQIGEEQSRGIEFDVTGRISSNWSIVASAAYIKATITESDEEAEIGRQKPNTPSATGNIWTKYVIDNGPLTGLGFGLGANFVSERFGSIVFDQNNVPTFPSYEIINAGLYYTADKFQIQVNLNNVFDQTHWVGGYDYIRAFPGSPRAVLTTVSYTF